MWLLILGLSTAALLLIYAWMKHRYGFWARRGIPFIPPTIIVGNFKNLILKKQNIAEIVRDIYNDLKCYRFGGTYTFLTPTLMITDPELIKDITVKNFDHFHDRNSVVNEKTDPLAYRALVTLKGQEWKEMRNTLSPAFTTSKLRGMFPLISRCSEQFMIFLKNRDHSEPLEFKAAFTRLTNDVIATVAFGVECNAVNDPDEEFYKRGQQLITASKKQIIISLFYMIVPKLMEYLDIPVLPRDLSSFFDNIIGKTMKYREENKVSRPDMLQLLMAAQKGGIERSHDDEQDVGTVGEDENAADLHLKHLKPERQITTKLITDEDISAQAFIFFIAGFETVSTLLSFVSHELAVNPDLQERLREEVDASILENDGKLNYEKVQSLKYLDMVISETLRKYPPAAFSDRVCSIPYKIPNSNLILEKGSLIFLPIYALHHDPEYFPNPDKFDPDRFSEENKKNIKPYTYIPFGSGPRNCIGMRLTLLEAKVCLCYLLATYELKVCSKTEVPLELSKTSTQMIPDAGIWLSVVPRSEPSIAVK